MRPAFSLFLWSIFRQDAPHRLILVVGPSLQQQKSSLGDTRRYCPLKIQTKKTSLIHLIALYFFWGYIYPLSKASNRRVFSPARGPTLHPKGFPVPFFGSLSPDCCGVSCFSGVTLALFHAICSFLAIS